MSKDQLAELVLDLYSAKKEIKDYLEFFLNPDVEKLYEKFKSSIDKELRRSKYGRSKARISKLKSICKDMASYSPGFETMVHGYIYIIRQMVYYERYLTFPSVLAAGLQFFVHQLVSLGNDEIMLDSVVSALDLIISDDSLGRQYYRRQLKETLNSELEELRSRIK